MLVTPGWESSAFHLQILGTGAPPGMAPPGYGRVVAGEKGHAVSKGGLCYGGGTKVFWCPDPFFPRPTSLFPSHLLPAEPPEMLPSHRCCNYLQLLPREKGLYLLKRGEMKVGLKAWAGGLGREVAFQPRN